MVKNFYREIFGSLLLRDKFSINPSCEFWGKINVQSQVLFGVVWWGGLNLSLYRNEVITANLLDGKFRSINVYVKSNTRISNGFQLKGISQAKMPNLCSKCVSESFRPFFLLLKISHSFFIYSFVIQQNICSVGFWDYVYLYRRKALIFKHKKILIKFSFSSFFFPWSRHSTTASSQSSSKIVVFSNSLTHSSLAGCWGMKNHLQWTITMETQNFMLLFCFFYLQFVSSCCLSPFYIHSHFSHFMFAAFIRRKRFSISFYTLQHVFEILSQLDFVDSPNNDIKQMTKFTTFVHIVVKCQVCEPVGKFVDRMWQRFPPFPH